MRKQNTGALKQTRSGLVWRSAAVAIALIALAVLATVEFGSRLSPIATAKADGPADAISDAQLDLMVLASLGVSPKNLILAGCTSGQCGTFVTAVRGEVAEREAQIRTALNGPDVGGTALAAVITAIKAESIDLMDEGHRTKLALLKANSGRAVPDTVKLLERTDAQWRSIEGAYATRRAYQHLGREVPGAVTSVISQIEGESAVTTGATALSTSLTDAQTAWNSALQAELP